MATRREEELRTSRETKEFRAWWDRFYGTRSLNPQPYVVRRAAWHAWATVKERSEASGENLCPACLEQTQANEIKPGLSEKLDSEREKDIRHANRELGSPGPKPGAFPSAKSLEKSARAMERGRSKAGK